MAGAAALIFEPLLEHDVVPRTVALLSGFRAAFQCLHTRGWHGGGDSGGAGSNGQSLVSQTAFFLVDAVALLETCSGVVMVASSAACADPDAVRPLRVRLHQQLTADATVPELVHIPAFVQQHLWPLASAGGEDWSNTVGGTADGASAPGASQQDPQRAPPRASRAGSGMSKFSALAVPFSFSLKDGSSLGSLVLGSAAGYVAAVVETAAVSRIFEAAARSFGSGSRAEPVALRIERETDRFLATAAETGLVASLCAALLAAPPWPEAAPDAEELHEYTRAISLAQRRVISVLFQLAYCDTPAYLKPLADPDVRRLQWELLEQVAATAGDSATAPQQQGRQQQQRQQQRWPVLQKHVLRLVFGPALQINEVLNDCVGAVTKAGPKVQECAGMKGTMDYLAGLFPARGSAAALAARVCAALHARLDALGAAGAQPRQGVKVTPQKLVGVAEELRRLVLLRLVGATVEEQRTCLPDVYAMHGWMAAMWATPAGLLKVGHEGIAQLVCTAADILQGAWFNGASLPSAYAGELEKMPDSSASSWEQLSPGIQSACLRRLQPTNLPASLDKVLRHLAATAQGGRLQPIGALLPSPLVDLIGPLLRERLVRWRVQQQLKDRSRVALAASAAAGGPRRSWAWWSPHSSS